MKIDSGCHDDDDDDDEGTIHGMDSDMEMVGRHAVFFL